MSQLKNVENELLATVLGDRYNSATKHKIGDLDLGSIVISKCEDPGEAIVYAILVLYRKNQKDCVLASLHTFDGIDLGYKLKNDEEVAHLVCFGNDE